MAWIILLCLLLPSAAFAEAPIVTWMMVDTPPFHIAEGPMRDQGIRDRQQEMLRHLLPQFEHRRIVATAARNWHDLQHNDGVCIIGVVHTPERDAIASYSARGEPGNVNSELIIKKARVVAIRKHLTADLSVDLSSLAQNSYLIGGYQPARAYSTQILDLIADQAKPLHLDPVITVAQMFNLLEANRLDFFLAKPIEAAFFAEQAAKKVNYVALRIKGMDAPKPTHVACSNGPTGRAVIATIDSLMQDEARWQSFVAIGTNWEGAHILPALTK